MEYMKGINTALLTPFTREGKIDKEALKGHLDFLVEKGVHGIYILGTTGEAFLLGNEERKEILELVINYAAGRVPVYVMVGSIPTGLACELAVHAEEVGAAGIGAITPIYHSVNQEEIKEYYCEIARSISDDYPLYLYNLPDRSGSDLLLETVLDLSEVVNIVGIKNSMSDIRRLYSLIDKLEGDFNVLQGYDPLIFPAMVYGAKGAVSGISNVFPELFVRLYDAIMRKDYAKARKMQKICTQACDILQGGASLAYLKNAVALRGLKKTYTRKPLLDISENELIKLEKDIKEILKYI